MNGLQFDYTRQDASGQSCTALAWAKAPKPLTRDERAHLKERARMLLKERGMTAETAENGREGLEKFVVSDAGWFDAVLMDLRMPVMDGCETARRIRALARPDAKEVPIVAMTADAFEESVRESREAGMNGYVTKPVDPRALYAALVAAISRRRQTALK